MLFILVLIGAALIIGLLTYDMPAWFVTLQISDLNLSINIAMLIAALILLGLVVFLLMKFIRLPLQIWQGLHGRQNIYAAEAMNRGLMLYLEGQLRDARKALLSAAKNPIFAPGANLLVVRCAIQEKKTFYANEALKTARRLGCDSFILSLMQAEILIAERKFLQAHNLLNELKQTCPNNNRIVQLLKEIAPELEDAHL